jgi:dUTP pyrophosphatase
MAGVLSREEILRLIHCETPLVKDYINLGEQVQPNGFDLTLREVAMIQTGGKIAVSNAERVVSNLSPLFFDGQGQMDLVAGAYVITFNEIVSLPNNIMAMGAPRSSLLRCGVNVHMAIWDAGYSGRSQSLLVVYNPICFRVQKNARIAQLVFMQLCSETEGYRGTYQGENVKARDTGG